MKNFIDVGAGVVDYDYRGNVGVVLFNHGDQDFAVARGDRVAQLVLERISMASAVEVQELSDTTRGSGGFGSTGVSEVATAATDGRESPKRQRVEEGSAAVTELLCVKKLTELATVPTRGSQFAAGNDTCALQLTQILTTPRVCLCTQASISAARTIWSSPSTARQL